MAAGLLGISAGPMNTLQRRHPISGVGLWTLQLDSPPVAVHLADGSSVNLYAQKASDSTDSMVVVGMLRDSMYALPVSADWLQRSLPRLESDGVDVESLRLHHHLQLASEPHMHGHGGAIDAGTHQSPGGPADSCNSQSRGNNGKQKRDCAARSGGDRDVVQSAVPDAQRVSPQPILGQPVARLQHSKDPAGNSRVSHALVPLPSMHSMPSMGSEDSMCAWQSPVSIHSVVPSLLPQTFLPVMREGFSLVAGSLSGDMNEQGSTGECSKMPSCIVWKVLVLLHLAERCHADFMQQP